MPSETEKLRKLDIALSIIRNRIPKEKILNILNTPNAGITCLVDECSVEMVGRNGKVEIKMTKAGTSVLEVVISRSDVLGTRVETIV